MRLSPNSSFADLVGLAVDYINMLVPLLGGFAIVLFLAGVVRYLVHAGDAHSKNQDKEIMVWGIIALFVLFSVWGILRLLRDTFLGGAYTPPASGQYDAPNSPSAF